MLSPQAECELPEFEATMDSTLELIECEPTLQVVPQVVLLDQFLKTRLSDQGNE